MAEKPKDTSPTPEEIKEEEREEEELSKESKEEEVRADIVKKHELDEETDKELIDHLTQDKLEDMKRFGKLVSQKRTWRDKALKKPEEDKPKEDQPKGEKYVTKEDLAEDRFQGQLDALDLSDELRKEAESYARLHKVSPKEAFKSDYIQFKKKQEDDKAKQEDATPGATRKTHTTTKLDFDTMSDADLNEAMKNVDAGTEEGQKQLQQITAELNKRG